jgi:AbrB family looped-hinge helix DNA binding protein
MATTVSSKGQVILPAEIRQQDGIKPGQKFEVERIDCGEYRLKRKQRRRNESLVKLLFACPVMGQATGLDRNDRPHQSAATRMTCLVDVNVLSEPTWPAPDAKRVSWFSANEGISCFRAL